MIIMMMILMFTVIMMVVMMVMNKSADRSDDVGRSRFHRHNFNESLEYKKAYIR